MKSTKTHGDEQYIYAMTLLGGMARGTNAENDDHSYSTEQARSTETGNDTPATPATPKTGKEITVWIK